MTSRTLATLLSNISIQYGCDVWSRGSYWRRSTLAPKDIDVLLLADSVPCRTLNTFIGEFNADHKLLVDISIVVVSRPLTSAGVGAMMASLASETRLLLGAHDRMRRALALLGTQTLTTYDTCLIDSCARSEKALATRLFLDDTARSLHHRSTPRRLAQSLVKSVCRRVNAVQLKNGLRPTRELQECISFAGDALRIEQSLVDDIRRVASTIASEDSIPPKGQIVWIADACCRWRDAVEATLNACALCDVALAMLPAYQAMIPSCLDGCSAPCLSDYASPYRLE